MSESVRIDRWLFMCRFFKSRSLATRAAAGGHVHLNGERAAPGTQAKPGMHLEGPRAVPRTRAHASSPV